jgi:hypothetical protein
LYCAQELEAENQLGTDAACSRTGSPFGLRTLLGLRRPLSRVRAMQASSERHSESCCKS